MGTELPENLLEGKMSLANCCCQPEPYIPGLTGSATPACLLDLFPCEVRILHKCLEPILSYRDVFVTRVWAQTGSQYLSVRFLERAIVSKYLEPGPWRLCLGEKGGTAKCLHSLNSSPVRLATVSL